MRFSFFSYSWIWGISLLTFVGTEHGHELPVWHFTISELLDNRDGVLISAFHKLLMVNPRPESPKPISEMTYQ